MWKLTFRGRIFRLGLGGSLFELLTLWARVLLRGLLVAVGGAPAFFPSLFGTGFVHSLLDVC